MPVCFPATYNVPARTEYVGCVLSTRERNGYDDSDFYAMVWDEDSGKVREVTYDTTRCYVGGSATVDATDDVKEKAGDYMVKMARASLEATDAEASKAVAWCREVTVVKGRKVPKGTTGEVMWMGTAKYGARTVTRVGFRTLDGTVHYTDAGNLEVVDPERYRTPAAELDALAERARGRYGLASSSVGSMMVVDP